MKTTKTMDKGVFTFLATSRTVNHLTLYARDAFKGSTILSGFTNRYLESIEDDINATEQVMSLKHADIFKYKFDSLTAESVFVCYLSTSDMFAKRAAEYALDLVLKNPGIKFSEVCTPEEYSRVITGQDEFNESKWYLRAPNWELLTTFFDEIDLTTSEIVETHYKYNFLTLVTKELAHEDL